MSCINKIILLFFLLLPVRISATHAEEIIRREQVLKLLCHSVDTTHCDIYMSKDELTPSEVICVIPDTIMSPLGASHFLFVDYFPRANWGHKAKLFFIDSKNNIIDSILCSFPPVKDMNIIVKSNELLEECEIVVNSSTSAKSILSANISASIWDNSPNNFALIINGGYNKEYNHERYWNDCSQIYQTLIQKYKYKKSNIKILMSDGTDPADDMHKILGGYASSPLDLDNDNVNDIQQSATSTNINSALNYYYSNLNLGDNLFIFVTDHGGIKSDSTSTFICGWNTTILYDYVFCSTIKLIANKGINVNIVMGQCNSGGSVSYLSSHMSGSGNVVISSACRKDESSWSNTLTTYDEYLYHWTSSVKKENPNGTSVNADLNNDGFISMSEAFHYAKVNDTKNEHPLLYSYPTSLASKFTLYGILPNISGATSICTASENYTINYVPSGSSVTWSITPIGKLSIVSQSDNNVTLQRVSNTNSGVVTLTATITRNSATYTVTKTIQLLNINTPFIRYSPPGTKWYRNEARTFTIHNCPSSVGNDITWVIKKNGSTIETGHGLSYTFTPTNIATYTIRATDAKHCSSQNYAEVSYAVTAKLIVSSSFSAEGNYLNINIGYENSDELPEGIFLVDIFNTNGILLYSSKIDTSCLMIPIKDIKSDSFVVKIFNENKEEIYNKLIIKQNN